MSVAPVTTKPSRSSPVTERFLFTAVLIAFSLMLLITGWTQRLDYIFYDSFIKWKPTTTTTSSVIVAIDEKSLNDLGRWPWDRRIHAELVKKLKAAGAEAIVFDILLSENSGTMEDQLLQQQIALAGNVLLPLHIDHRSASGRMTEILPTPGYVAAAAGLGHVHIELDQDGIARGLYLYQGLGDSYWSSLALAAYQWLSQPLPETAMTTADKSHLANQSFSNRSFAKRPFSNPTLAKRSLPSQSSAAKADPSAQPKLKKPGTELLNIREAYRLIPFTGPPGSFATLSYSDVLRTELPTGYFTGRVVFVGATAAGLGDFIATPVSADFINMPGAEVHANVYEALADESLGTLVAPLWQYAITLGTVLLVSLIFPRLSPNQNLPLVIVCCLIITVLSYFVLLLFHHWFAPVSLLLTLLIAYPFWSWRRLQRLSRFLNQELERLADEPKLRDVSAYQSPQQWAQQLVRLLKPEIWEFRPYKRGGDPQFDIDENKHSAEIYLPVHDQNNRSALYMKFISAPKELNAIATYVHRLFPEFQAALPHQSAPGELMDRRIAQVRRAITAMRDMRQFISDTVSNMPDGVLVSDEFSRIMFLNGPAREWLQKEAKPGSFVAEVMPVNQSVSTAHWEQRLRQVLLYEQHQTEEIHEDSKAVLITLAPVNFTNHNRGMVITFADISVIHEAQLKRMETIHFISHDLRAPLASQLALLDTLKLSLPAKFEARLLTAQNLTEKSLALSDQFLQLARVESADHIHLYQCELLDIIDNAVDSISPLAKQAEVLINNLADIESIPINGNPELLERSVTNLLQNAIKFSPAHSSIEIRVSASDGQAMVSIQDRGQGIEAQEIPHLFKPYRRTRASEQSGVAGSGLGLRLVKLVMDRHGGSIRVNSQPGKGTCFSLLLPLHSSETST